MTLWNLTDWRPGAPHSWRSLLSAATLPKTTLTRTEFPRFANPHLKKERQEKRPFIFLSRILNELTPEQSESYGLDPSILPSSATNIQLSDLVPPTHVEQPPPNCLDVLSGPPDLNVHGGGDGRGVELVMGGGRQGNDRVSGVRQDGVQVSPITPVIFYGARSAITAGVHQFPANPPPCLGPVTEICNPSPPYSKYNTKKNEFNGVVYCNSRQSNYRRTSLSPIHHRSSVGLQLSSHYSVHSTEIRRMSV